MNHLFAMLALGGAFLLLFLIVTFYLFLIRRRETLRHEAHPPVRRTDWGHW